MKAQYSVLFVCLGNICRSPLAEGIFRHLVKERGLGEYFLIDSCGTGGWHADEPPDPRSRKVATENGVSLRGQRARQISKNDLKEFHFVIAMDRSNLRDIKSLGVKPVGELFCLREYDPKADDLDIPDPYYGGERGFEDVFAMLSRSLECFLDRLESELNDGL